MNNDKHDNKVPTDCDVTDQLKDDKKHASEDITGDTYSKNTNGLNDKQSVTSVSTLPSIIHADSIIEEDVKSDDLNSKTGY